MNNNLQRSYSHDYKAPCIYLLTVTVEGHRPVLGTLAGDVDNAHIELSPLGEAVRYELYALCQRYPQLRLLQYQIMPDHVHIIIQATERLPKPLGSLFSSWKIACGHAYARLTTTTAAGASALTRDEGKARETTAGASALAQNEGAGTREKEEGGSKSGEGMPVPSSGAAALAPTEKAGFRRLFAEGYNDRILQGDDQLQHMIAYVRDNPRRLLIKRTHSPYFTLHRALDIAVHRMDAVGNLSLLQKPLLAVHCRRHWTEQEKQAYIAHCLTSAEKGSVLIGAFISPHEQAIAHAAQEKHLPLIHLMENGFPEQYKPVGQAFYTCAEGHLLQLAPWKHHAARTNIRREQCNAMNTMAETIATTLNTPQ